MKKISGIVSFIVVCFLVFSITAILPGCTAIKRLDPGYSKLDEIQELIEFYFVGEYDTAAMQDAAAAAMVDSLGDEWSYYISAEEYGSFMEAMTNSYVGIGITISVREDGYLDITEVQTGGPAYAAGIQPGDILIRVDGQDCAELGMDETRKLVRGEEGTEVELLLRRGDRKILAHVERKQFDIAVAEYEMLEDQIGLVTILNFDERCADETIAAIDTLIAQGAEGLIFDVRNNPGGYKDELVKVLDYLLPEGDLFISEYFDGTREVDTSDERYLDIPMAVLVNGESYSAAEFFAAAMSEYDAAVVVGEKTYGKGYFQQTFPLDDGSAVGLSVGKYYTPQGVNLAGEGVTPDVDVPVDDETFLQIYYGELEADSDPQILAAIDALISGN